jgi:YD repeat-containing protein
MTVKSPDGMVYTYEEFSYVKDNEKASYSLTRAEDKNGNYYTVSYKNISLWDVYEDTDGAPVSYVIRGIDRIVTSDGKIIEFLYNPNGRLEAINVNGRVWTYSYLAEPYSSYKQDGYLVDVTGPENYKWHYDYITGSDYKEWLDYPQEVYNRVSGVFCLSKVTTPFGATVDYEYMNIDEGVGGLVRYLKTRTLTLAGQSPKVWNYQYSQITSVPDEITQTPVFQQSNSDILSYITDLSAEDKLKYRFAKVEAPDRIEVHRYCDMYSQSTNEWLVACSAYSGEILNKRIYDRVASETQGQLVLLEEVNIDKIVFEGSTLQTLSGYYTAPIGFARDLQRSTYRDGEHYNILWSNFDTYMHPQLISEFTGTPLSAQQLANQEFLIPEEPGRIKRYKAMTYHNDTLDKWFVGAIESEKLLDYGDSTGVQRQPDVFNTFDPKGNVNTTKNFNALTSYDYYPNGDLWRITDPEGKIKAYSNYKNGIPQREDMEEGVYIARQVDDFGNILSVTDGRQYTTSYTYDGLNRIKSISTARLDDNDIRYTYSWIGTHVVKTRGAYIQRYTFDGLGRLLEENDGGILKHYAYDDQGRLQFASLPNSSYGTQYEYDPLNRVTRVVNTADNTDVSYVYLPANQVEITDQNNNITLQTFRAFSSPDNRDLMSVEQKGDGESIVTAITRTQRGDVFDVTQGKTAGAYSGDPASIQEAMTRQYTYDANYYMDQFNYPESGLAVVTKNAVGNTTQKEVGVGTGFSSGLTSYIYDNLHRLKTIDYEFGVSDINYSYDGNNNITQVVRGSGESQVTTDYTYDENNNLKTEVLTVAGNSYTIVYIYDANDALQAVEYPSGLVVNYFPNTLGQATQASGFVSNITYHPNGQVNTLSYLNGRTLTIGQNSKQQTESILANGGTTLVNLGYTYDAVGNVKNVTDGINPLYNLTLGYDAYHRLTQADGFWGAGSIGYNSRGDITRKTIGSSDLVYSYMPNTGLLESIAGTADNRYGTVYYDAYRNIGYDGVNQYTYDEGSNLVSIDNKNFSYNYDGNNYRVLTDENGYKTYMQYNRAGSLVYEYDPQKQIAKNYIRVAGMQIARKDILEDCMPLDDDGDGLVNCQEYRIGSDPQSFDTDGDGAGDGTELSLGTSLTDPDTDADGIPDGYEILTLLNPLFDDSALDFDGDGYTNLQEYQSGTLANDPSDIPGGNLQWEFSDQGRQLGTPVFDQNNVMYLASDDELIAIQPDSSATQQVTLWRTSLPGSVTSSPTVGLNGNIYLIYHVPGNKSGLAAISPEGQLKCSVLLKVPVATTSKPAVGLDGRIYVYGETPLISGSTSVAEGELYGINPDCTLDWSYQYATSGYTTTGVKSPVIDQNGNVNFLMDNEDIYEISPDGTQVNQLSPGSYIGSYSESALIVGDTNLRYYASNDIYRVTGGGSYMPYNQDLTASSKHLLLGDPGNTGNQALITDDGTAVKAIAASNGAELWNYAYAPATLVSILLGDNNMVYLALTEAANNRLVALRVVDNAPVVLWSYPVASNITGMAQGADGDLYLVTADHLYSISSSSRDLQASPWPVFGGDRQGRSNACLNNHSDMDGDQIPDCYENQFGMNATDPADANDDLDMDGLSNLAEYLQWTQANNADSDGDGISDGDEVSLGLNPLDYDSDHDGMWDGYETTYGLDPHVDDAQADLDLDGAVNLIEAQSGTDPGDPLDVAVDAVIQWQTNPVVSSTMNTPAIGADGSIYITELNGQCHKLGPNGDLQWTVNVTAGLASISEGPMLATDGTLYVVAGSQLYAISNDGLQLDMIFDVDVEEPGAHIQYKPVLSQDGLLYIVDDVGSFYAIDPGTRTLVYSKSFTSRQVPFVDLMRPVVTDDGTALIGLANTDNLNTLSASRKSVSTISLGYPLIKDYTLLPAAGGHYFAVVMKNSQPVLMQAAPDGRKYIVSQVSDDSLPVQTPVITTPDADFASLTGVFYGSDQGLIYKLAGLNVQWRHLLKGPLITAPALSANGTIYIARDGQLSALQDRNKSNQWEQNFSTRWQLSLDMAIEHIAVAHGFVYVASSNGDMAKISDSNGGYSPGYWMMDGHDPQSSYNLALSDSSYLVDWLQPILPGSPPAQQSLSPLLAWACDATQPPLASL